MLADDTLSFETDRLILRDWKEDDFIPLCALNTDERVMEFFLNTLSEDKSRELYNKAKAEISYYGYGPFAVERKEDKQFIGFVGLHNFDIGIARGVELAWRLFPDFWGLGYATEAATACLQYAMEEVELYEVCAFTSLPNKRSESVMQKIGMGFIQEFDHPRVPSGHPLLRHVLYKKSFKK